MALGNNNVPLLRLIGLPVFSKVSELAEAIHIMPGVIKKHTEDKLTSYDSFTIPKYDGTSRQIRAPKKDLKAIQAWILRNILDGLAKSPYATAYIRDKSILNNVLPHINNRYYICIDLEDFFPSISMRRVFKLGNYPLTSRSFCGII